MNYSNLSDHNPFSSPTFPESKKNSTHLTGLWKVTKMAGLGIIAFVTGDMIAYYAFDVFLEPPMERIPRALAIVELFVGAEILFWGVGPRLNIAYCFGISLLLLFAATISVSIILLFLGIDLPTNDRLVGFNTASTNRLILSVLASLAFLCQILLLSIGVHLTSRSSN